jgi:CNT family concentrative nucleoside transporter
VGRATALAGIAVLLGIAWSLSTARRAVRWRSVGVALALQVAIALAVLRTPFGRAVFAWLNDLAVAFVGAADAGIEFMFGRWPREVMGAEGGPVALPYVFAVRVLPIVVFMSSVFGVLQHYGVLQCWVDAMARGLRRLLHVSGAEALAVSAEVFLGMTESPLLIRPYVPALTRSELFCVMTAGMATVAGSVLVAYIGMLGPEYAGHLIAASFMSAPAAIGIAKLMVPELETPATLGAARVALERDTRNGIDAAAAGAALGVRLALNIGGMLIAFVALIHLANALLGWAGSLVGQPDVTLESVLGALLSPVAWLIGVPWDDAARIGELLGVKTVLNEFIAYQRLAELRAALEPRSMVIASYALCGFANFGSLAVLLGGLSGIAPERRSDVARDGLRAVLAGSLATFVNGAIAGLLI